MFTNGIIDQNELTRIRKQSDELVFLQDLKKIIIDKIYRQWNGNIKFIEDEINYKYFKFKYTISDNFNRTGNRTFEILETGQKIHDYKYNDIKNWLKRVLFDD